MAFANRGGINAVRRKSSGHSTHIGLRLRMDLAEGGWADCAFDIAARPREAFKVARERCIVQPLKGGRHEFEIKNGKFTREMPGIRPRLKPDRSALTVLSALEEFRAIESVQGLAHITPFAKTTREIIRQRLYIAGELLRQGELEFDRNYADQAAKQLNLFGNVEGA